MTLSGQLHCLHS